MALFNAPNDIHWRNTTEQYQRSDSRLYYAKVLDVDNDGNWSSNQKQQVSVELIGWDVKIKNCSMLVGAAGFNGEGDYKNFQKGDIVVGTAREGQLNEFIITGSVRLNGSYQDFEGDGKQLKPAEAVEGSLANQATLHPTRITKLEGNFWMKAVHGLKSLYQSPSNAEAVEDILDKQGLPGVIKLQTKEGVDMTYAYGGIVQYTEGNYIVVSGGSKINKCTKFLKQSKRHMEIANSLRDLTTPTILDNEIATPDLEEVENSTEIISSDNEIRSIVNNKTVALATPSKDKEEEAVLGFSLQGEGKLISDPKYRAKKHLELSFLAANQALNCNTSTASFQQQANLVVGQYGSYTNGGIAPTTDNQGQPTGKIGQVNPSNYTNRGAGQNPKPSVEFIAAAGFSPNINVGPNFRLFLHHTAGSMEGGIEMHQKRSTRASAHYFVGRDGRIVQMVKEKDMAWHNETSNSNSFGIEVVATATEKGMTPIQEDALIKLCRYLCETYNITPDKVFGHNVVKSTLCPTWIWPTQADVVEWAKNYLTL